MIHLLILSSIYCFTSTIICILLAYVIVDVKGTAKKIVGMMLKLTMVTNPVYLFFFLSENLDFLIKHKRLPHEPSENDFVKFVGNMKNLLVRI
ncbi:MAG: hypothetical protein OEY59_10925 [Deltaproteobacteria bacterium]|nr:hypothetical protein [Deltaproteobacteria bacterium]